MGEQMKLINADCIEAMKAMPDNSVDSIVTDPPYELGFMGKSWDASGIAFNIEVWQEALRVIKPGGHLIAFSGSRTYHRMAVAIEDAGFQIRDQIMWVYGSGFPKSHNISKGIDKRGGSIPSQNEFGKFLQNAKSKTKFTIADINEALGRRTSNLWSHFVGDIQPLLPTFEQYLKLKEILQFDNSWDHLFIDEAEREVVGKGTSTLLNQSGTSAPTAIILENTFSEIPTFSRTSTGVYKLELIDLFTLDKTFIVTGSADVSAGTGDFATVIARRFDEDTITLYTYDNFTSSDNMLVNTSIEIRVYE
jgi:hypothetical protein